MSLDVVDLREFYINPLGRLVRRMLRRRLGQIWPQIKGDKVLALGYGTPLLRPWLEQGAQLVAVMGGAQGVAYWPREGPNCSCLANLTDLPLPDESVDRAVIIHALETAADVEALLREVWRVLKAEGRLLVIVPNRRGVWAHSDQTPFGTGQPFSGSQLKALLRDQGYLVDRVWRALYFPPSPARLLLALAEKLEKFVGLLFPGFGGVLIVEASKQVYAPLLTKARKFQPRLVLPLPFPVPSNPVPTGRNLTAV